MPMSFWIILNLALIAFAMMPLVFPKQEDRRYPIGCNIAVGAGVIILATVVKPATNNLMLALIILLITGVSPMVASHIWNRRHGRKNKDD